MKKKLTTIILSLILALSMTTGLFACKDPTDPPITGLTPEQQVQIAKDTFNGIYQAEKSTNINAMMSISQMSTSFSQSEYDELFDKYEYSNYSKFETMLPTAYFLLAQPFENLLYLVGSQSISSNYSVEYNFTNGEPTDNDFFDEDSLPKLINFHGIKEEDGYNKIYTTSQLAEDNGYMTLTTYYNSDSDYGYEFVHYEQDTFNTPNEILGRVQYYKFDKKNNVAVIINKEGTDIVLVNHTKAIRDTIESIDIDYIDSIILDCYNSFITDSTKLEKSNNNGNMKMSATNTVTLDFDMGKFSQIT